ncbi:hypothetical protein [Xanthomonas euroxanthea]|uniref:hypothetical protein n=1 Tax=Xanthomonas euroxanthea TaxID=2259622 RepID=UPI003CCC9249
MRRWRAGRADGLPWRCTAHVSALWPAMLHCSVICSLMIAIFICEQTGIGRLVDVAMPSSCFPDSVCTCPAAALRAECAA